VSRAGAARRVDRSPGPGGSVRRCLALPRIAPPGRHRQRSRSRFGGVP